VKTVLFTLNIEWNEKRFKRLDVNVKGIRYCEDSCNGILPKVWDPTGAQTPKRGEEGQRCARLSKVWLQEGISC